MKKKIKLVISKASSFVAPLFNQPKKHLKTWLVIFLALIAGLAAFFFLLSPRTTEAAWWDETWLYRKAVQISNSNGADLTDFQVAITLDTVSLITAGKMQGDCDDLRITDQNGQILPHWIEENNPGCNNAATKVWVKIPTVHKGDNATTVYAYYGNAQAENAENGDNVFEFFDDFESYQIGQAPPGYTVLAGSGTASIQEVAGTKVLQFSAESGSHLIKDNLSLADIRLYTSANSVSGSYVAFFVRGQNTSARNYYVWNLGTGTTIKRYYRYVNDVSYNITSVSESWNQGQFYPLSIKAVGNNITFYDGNTQKGTITWTDFSSGSIGVHMGGSNITQQFRYFFACKGVIADPTTSLNAEEISPGPVAYWKFDEGTGTTAHDSSGQGNHGTFGIDSSAPSWQSEDMCVSGKCLKFDGNDYVNSGNGNSLNFSTGNFSIGGWFKAKPGNTTRAIASKNSDNVIWWRIQIQTDGTLNFQFDDNIVKYSWTSTSRVDDNNWHHFSITRGSTYEIYIDGKSQNASGTINASTLTNSGNLLIGGDLKGSYFFDGFIDEVKIYPYARTKEQIKADYAAGLAGIGSAKGSSAIMGSSDLASALNDGLVGYWKMDEVSWNGTTGEVIDASGNGNHGVAVNGATTGAGKYGNGGVFDGGDDYATIPDAPAFNFATNTGTTISLWFKTNSNDKFLFDHYNGGIPGSGWYISIDSNGKLRFGHRGAEEILFASTMALNDNFWHHAVITFTPTNNAKMYIDGEFNSADTSYSGLIDRHESLTIGNLSDFAYYYSGSLDEVRIYNRALSPAEVKALYEWAPGPVAHYTFDDSSNSSTVADMSGYGNNGTWFGSSTQRYAPGKYGSAGKFNGSDDYVSINDSSSLKPIRDITVGAWVKFDSVVGSNRRIVSKAYQTGQWVSPYVQYELTHDNSGTQYVGFRVGTAYAGTSGGILNVIPNRWYYLTGTYDGSKVRIYVDGVEMNSTNYTSNIDYTYSTPLEIGKMTTNSGWMHGNLDEVKIYNYARTQKQILEDMEGGAPGQARMPQPIAHWRFDEGYGNIAHNALNNNNITLYGSIWSNSGKFNKALFFDGNENYAQGENVSIGTGDFTITSWIYPQSNPPGDNYSGGIFGQGVTNSVQLYLTSSGYLGLRVYNGSTYTGWAHSSSETISENQWQHVAYVAQRNGNGTFFLNGKNVGQIDISSRIAQEIILNSKIGRNTWLSSTTTDQTFYGLIDEVKIYNYALTPEEVALDYNQGMAAVMGQSSANTGSTAPGGSAAQEYCVPGSTDYCAPPVAEWNFEENTGTTARDTSGNGNDGTWYGSSIQHYAPGKYGSAGVFNGSDDYVDINNAFGQPNIITISTWFKTSSNGIIFGQHNNVQPPTSPTGFTPVFWVIPDGRLRAELWTGAISAIYTSGSVADNKWHQAVMVGNNTNQYLYLDGALVGSRGGTITQNWWARTAIGTGFANGRESYGAVWKYFPGLIDQVRIYNYARTPAQIAWDYNRGGPVGHWRFDECEGTVAHDVSGNENHGTINIGATAPQTSAGTCQIPGTAWGNGAAGKLNSAMSFDGVDDWVSISDNTNHFDFGTGNFTFSAWIYKPSGGKGSPGIISKNGNPGYKFNLNANTGLYLGIYDGSWHDYASATSIVKNNSWQHVAITADRDGNVGYFVNGELKDTDNISGTALVNLSNSSSLLIGDDNWCRADYCGQFDGLIDDVQIFNYALTPLQIKTLYNNGAVRFGE